MEISFKKTGSNLRVCDLPVNTVIRILDRRWLFIIPEQPSDRGVWITTGGIIKGSERKFEQMCFYNDTDYEILGVLNIDF